MIRQNRAQLGSAPSSLLQGNSIRSISRLQPVLCFVLTLVMPAIAAAQTQPLLTHHVREVTLNGQAPYVGPLPASQSMSLDIVLPLRDPAGLGNFLQGVYDPSNPSYHHFLTVQDFTATFGPRQADYDSVVSFAAANGFTVVGGSRDGMSVHVKGSVSTVEKAFHVTMGSYKHPTENRTFFAPDREPTVALTTPLWHVSGLDNYSIPRPLVENKNLVTSNDSDGSTPPNGSCPSSSYCGSDMRAAYYGGTSLTGAGQSIGLLEYYGYEIADLNTYYANAGQTLTATVTGVSTDGTTLECDNGCDDTEQILDMTQALGMAPGVNTLYVFVGSSDTAILSAMTTASPLPLQLSSSWVWTPVDPETDDPYFQRMAAQGQSFFQASGDSDAWSSTNDLFPSEDGNVISVGGTDLMTSAAGGPWSSETGWADGGGGISPDQIAIPGWQQLPGVINENNGGSTQYRNGPDVSANANFTFYVCADQTTCTANVYGGTSFAAPMWAGYAALANQQAAAHGDSPLGFIDPAVYAIGVSSNYSQDFHDITDGYNGFEAVTGYDLISGWGSPNGVNLINALAPISNGPNFSIAPTALLVQQANSGTAPISTATSGGYSSAIALSASGLPAGVTVSFSPASIPAPGAGSSTMTVNAPLTTKTGIYPVTVIGTGGGITQTATVYVTVTGALTPIFSPGPQTYTAPISVTVTDGSPGTTIYYTLDGSTPTTSSTQYSAPIPIATTTTLSAIAVGGGYGPSLVASGTYAFITAQPSFYPASGSYSSAQSVTLTDGSPGTTMYYTTDGSAPTTSSARYSGPITVSTTTTINAIAVGGNYGPSAIASSTYYITPALPGFSPIPYTYNTAQTVTLTDSTPGAQIFYTLDGSTPTTSSSQYKGPITVASTTTINAIAAGGGYSPSMVSSATYTISALTPSISPVPYTYTTPQSVTLTDGTPGVTIYYTTDGSTPTTSSTRYSGAITVSTTTTINAIAAGGNYGPSNVASGTFTIVAATPSISPVPYTYNTPQSVTLTDSSPGVTIYYTTNGSTPTTASTPYTGPIPVSTTTTINAIAAGGGIGPSLVASGTYTITAITPSMSPVPYTYNTPQSVTLADSAPGVTIYYTTNGTTPTTASTRYTGAIPVSTTTTINAIAAGGNYGPSTVASGTYTIAAATPSFSLSPSTYHTPQSVTLTDSTPGTTIYYTTDGTTPTTASTQYRGAIPVSTTTTINAIAAGGNYGPSTVASGTYSITAATPSFSLAPSTYSTPQSVTLTDSTPGATIYYTTNGTTPTTASTQYRGAIPVSTTTTINAIAVGGNYGPSTVASGTYTFAAATPSMSPTPYTYTSPQTVTLTDSTPGVTIYYTTNGSTPTTASTQYTGAIPVSTTTTINAIAVGGNYGPSVVASGTYTITAATPSMSPTPYTYTSPQTVTLTDSTPGVTIYYTTNGTAPTTQSTVYSGPITVSSTTTINAMAAGGGSGSSVVASGTYTITAATPSMSPTPYIYTTTQTVTLKDSTPGVTIYYTTNGTTPTTQSTVYSGPITVSTTTTINAMAVGGGSSPSVVASGTYTIMAATPSMSPTPYTYSSTQTVTLKDGTPGATIYYTTNGTTPTTQSTVYSGPITVSSTTTINAMAAGGGSSPSVVASGTYTIN